MALPKIPGPDETIADLATLLPKIYGALEHGVYEAREHFETKSLSGEASAFSTLVRLHAKDYLVREGLDAVEVQDVNLCGLSLQLPKHWIKIWKSEDENLPAPGTSSPKRDFYQQPLFRGGETPEPLHLAVLWNLDRSNNLAALWLVCPEYGDEKSATSHWLAQIPHPATTVHISVREAVSPDLPMQLKVRPQTDTKTG